MKRQSLAMSGVTTADRHQVTTAIDSAILASEGWVVDHTLFSNIAITIRLALPVAKLDAFTQRIAEAGVRLDEASLTTSRTIMQSDESPSEEITVSLNVTFIHDEHDLRRTVPAVPG